MRSALQNRTSTRFWAYASSFGAAWGVWELTIGTFLHTLKVPFAGPLLASAAGALLIAQRQFIPVRGISLATGAVAALCKSISPDGTIFGPMIGILSEALTVEFVALLFSFVPRSPLIPIIAGAICANTPLLQKLISQLLFYGGGILNLYAETAKLAHLTLPQAALLLSLGLAFLGVVMGWGGYQLGQRGVRQLYCSDEFTRDLVPGSKIEGSPEKSSEIVPNSLSPHARRLLWGFSLLSILIQFKAGLLYSLASLLLMSGGLIALSPRSFVKIWRPRFWMYSIPIALLCGALLSKGNLSLGAEAALVMLSRAAWVLSLTSWLGDSLDRARVLKWFERWGFKQLGQAMNAAFGIMPLFKFSPKTQPQAFLVEAAELAERSARANRPVPSARIFAVLGKRHSGKTSRLMKLAEELKTNNFKIGGICQPVVLTKETPSGYQLFDLKTSEYRPFAKKRKIGFGYQFEKDGWIWAADRIKDATEKDEIVILDELGRLESNGKGHLLALQSLPSVLVVGVQEAFLAPITAYLGGIDSVNPTIERLRSELKRPE